MDYISIMDYLVFSDSLNNIKLTNNPLIISTINPHSYILAKNDTVFHAALKNSDILLPDGIGIVWAAKLLYGKKIKKIAGHDIFIYLMTELNNKGGACFFIGSSEKTLKKINKKVELNYSNVKVGYYSPPFKSEFSEADNRKMIEKINNFNPMILFVGLTAPKQEKWVYQNKNRICANVVCSIGAVFDFYAGTVKRSNQFWINLGLEWLPRFIQQPHKLWKRIFISNPLFVFNVLKHKFLHLWN